MNNGIRKHLLAAIGMSLILAAISSPSAMATGHSKSIKPVSAAYAFKGKTLSGINFSGAELAGKPVVLWFWAPWCTICRGEAPDLVALANTFKGKVRIIGVAGLGPVKDMKQFVADTHTSNIVHLADTDGAIWLHFQIPAQPAFVFLTAKGAATRQIGALSKPDLFAMTRQLLKKA
jgi:thiol-disulfide isomerase/thioredoxin